MKAGMRGAFGQDGAAAASPSSCGAPEDDTDGSQCEIELVVGSSASSNQDGDSPGT